MTQIRKEQKEFKLISEEKTHTIDWLEKNAVLITEGFDRSILHRLNSSISRFDQKFGPYKTRLPAIAKVLGDAEKGLYVVITGGTSKKSAAHMLERMTLIYNILSNFFGRDLHMLLKTPVFKTAVGMPDRALNMIDHPEHNQKMIKRVFVAALKPDKIEREVFDRVYKNIPMPSINWNEASKQLMGLCVNDLHELCGVEKVPAVVVNDSGSEESKSESVNPDMIMEIFRSIEERPQYQLLQRAITQLQQIAREHGLTSFNAAITNLSDDLLNLISSEDFGSRASTFFSSLGGLIRSNDPVQRLLSQATKAVQTFSAIRRVWNQNKEFFISRVRARGDGALNTQEEEAIKSLLTRGLERGGQIASGLRGLTAIEPYSGLEPEAIRDAFMEIIRNEVGRGLVYIVTYNDNGAREGDLEKREDRFTIGSTTGITLPGKGTLSKSGFDFDGWSTSATAGSGPLRSPYTPTGNVTLYARWVRAPAPRPAPESGTGGGGSPPRSPEVPPPRRRRDI